MSMQVYTFSLVLTAIIAFCSSLELKWSSSFNYVWVGPDLTTWNDAEAFCNLVFHTSLASIHSSSDNTEVINLCVAAGSSSCSIGLNDINTEGVYEWTDGSPIDFPLNWDSTQPNGAATPGEDGSAIMSNTNWHDTPITVLERPFICNAPKEILVWSENDNYIWAGPSYANWYDGDAFCKTTFGTSLASIHSDLQNTEITNLCNVWSGSPHCYIGLNDIDTEAVWQWIDESVIDYGIPNNWANGDPNNAPHGTEDEDCGITVFNYKWADTACSIFSYPFICNAPQNLEIWSKNGNYIWVGPAKMSWYDADNYCMNNFDTHLASIHSQSQYDEAQELCIKWNVKYDLPPASLGIFQSCYIGLNDIAVEGTWEWVDGTPVDFGPIWMSGEPNNNGPEDCAAVCYGCADGWADISCQDISSFHSTFICNAPPSCEDSGDITHINWDLITNDVNDDQIPYYNVTVEVDEDDLIVTVDADLAYLGTSCADNGICGFGTTYFISLNSFSSNTLDIFTNNGLSECDNRMVSSFVGTTWTDKWNVSETPYLKDHVGSDTYLAYPPSGEYWNLTAFEVDIGHKCDRINYFGTFSWSDLQSKCDNPQTNDSSVDIIVDNDWINLTGTFYINIVSPLYKDIDSGMYRIYELTNEQFSIAVSKSVHILGSTGISLYKISIIAINTDEGEFKLDVLTEAADYLQLSSESLLISPNGYEFNINPLNNGDCLSFKSNICIQTWQISTKHNETCNDFGGIYGIQWIAQCNLNIVNNTRCLSYNGDAVTLSVETDYEDTTCDTQIGKAQFDGVMRFYRNNSFTGNSNNDYLFIVGKDTIYIEIELNYPLNTYTIFDSKLINVWLCTIDDDVYGSTFSVEQTNPSNTGCLSSIIDNDGYNPYWIIQNFDQSFEHNAMHINNSNNPNIIRFSFNTPYTLTRDTLWIHAQIGLSLINNRRRTIERVLLDTESSSDGQMRHFMSSINVETPIIYDNTSTAISSTQKNQQQETDNAIIVRPTLYFIAYSIYIFLT